MTDATPPVHDDAPLPLALAAEVQDHLMTAVNDLDRLQALLHDAIDGLSSAFHEAMAPLEALPQAPSLQAAQAQGALAAAALAKVVTALQFHDMSSQLLGHTLRRLRGCADLLADQAFGPDDTDGPTVVEGIPQRPNPVTQDEMDAGSIELF